MESRTLFMISLYFVTMRDTIRHFSRLAVRRDNPIASWSERAKIFLVRLPPIFPRGSPRVHGLSIK
jgi:hypothetical protein